MAGANSIEDDGGGGGGGLLPQARLGDAGGAGASIRVAMAVQCIA